MDPNIAFLGESFNEEMKKTQIQRMFFEISIETLMLPS